MINYCYFSSCISFKNYNHSQPEVLHTLVLYNYNTGLHLWFGRKYYPTPFMTSFDTISRNNLMRSNLPGTLNVSVKDRIAKVWPLLLSLELAGSAIPFRGVALLLAPSGAGSLSLDSIAFSNYNSCSKHYTSW